MRTTIIAVLFLCFFGDVSAQLDKKINGDLSSFGITFTVDSTVWRQVQKEEFDLNSLTFLRDTGFRFYSGYVLKDSTNILNPPAVSLSIMEAPKITKERLKAQADSILTRSPAWEFFPSDLRAYYSDSSEQLVMRMRTPGNKKTTIHSVVFVDKGRMVMFKLLYTEESHMRYYRNFNEIIRSIKLF